MVMSRNEPARLLKEPANVARPNYGPIFSVLADGSVVVVVPTVWFSPKVTGSGTESMETVGRPSKFQNCSGGILN